MYNMFIFHTYLYIDCHVAGPCCLAKACSHWSTPICWRDGAYYYGTYTVTYSVLTVLFEIHLFICICVYSYGLSLVKGYKAQIKARRFASGEDFWQAVQASARSMSASIDTAKVESILQVSDSYEI